MGHQRRRQRHRIFLPCGGSRCRLMEMASSVAVVRHPGFHFQSHRPVVSTKLYSGPKVQSSVCRLQLHLLVERTEMYLTSDTSETGLQKQLNIMLITRHVKTHDIQNLHFKSSFRFSVDSRSGMCEMVPSSV